MTEIEFGCDCDKQYSCIFKNGEQLTNREVVDLLNDSITKDDLVYKLTQEKEALKRELNKVILMSKECYADKKALQNLLQEYDEDWQDKLPQS